MAEEGQEEGWEFYTGWWKDDLFTVKITGDENTVKIEPTTPMEAEALNGLSGLFKDFCADYANEDGSVVGVEISTRAVTDIFTKELARIDAAVGYPGRWQKKIVTIHREP